MATLRSAPFSPDYATAPGESLRQTLDELGMTQTELAERTGLSTKHVNQIVQGIAPVTPETALALERVTGAPAAFWTNLEAHYQLARAKQAEVAGAEAEREWVMTFPIAELRKRGVLSDRRDYAVVRQELLAFFGVAGRAAWERIWSTPEASFRRSRAYRIDNYATACWLRLGELQAQQISTEPFDAARFRRALRRIRRSMADDVSTLEPLMRSACADAGVALALVSEIKGSRAHGAVRWVGPGKALLQLSVRYRWEDVFWFSFFHEAGHLLLHGRKETFVEYGPNSSDREEREADEFAQQILVPEEDAARLSETRTDDDIRALAAELQLPPAVIVGRLQHDKQIPFTRGNHLRRKVALVGS